ncbi:hypothetical protein PQX77_020862 [Marasmius sp. AFHP31]|nr:hypothetical protein PQX77_020862 [Marasmius sp. AFHP31]
MEEKDTQTIIDLPLDNFIETPVNVLPNPLWALDEPYLTQNRYKKYGDYRLRNPRQRILLPPPESIEFSFSDFTSALGRTFLVAQRTPQSRTAPGTFKEFTKFSKKLKFNLTLSVPPTQTSESAGNLLEVRRMLFTGLISFAEVWEDALPDGVDKKLLYKDAVKFILKSAGVRKREDHLGLMLGREVFAYVDADWKKIMEEDLARSKWKGWRDGAL